jgi:hypothetical protein
VGNLAYSFGLEFVIQKTTPTPYGPHLPCRIAGLTRVLFSDLLSEYANSPQYFHSPRRVQRGSQRRHGWQKAKKILEKTKPEAVYFTEHKGKRGAIIIAEMSDASKIPALAEPWFLTFNADVEFRVAMTLADLEKAELDKLGKKWA